MYACETLRCVACEHQKGTSAPTSHTGLLLAAQVYATNVQEHALTLPEGGACLTHMLCGRFHKFESGARVQMPIPGLLADVLQ